MIRSLRLAAFGACILAVGGCDKTGAYGEVNSIIIGASMELWEAVGESVTTGLEPTIFTVRDEGTFRITRQDPLLADWEVLRQFKQVLVIGTAEDPWVAEALDEGGHEAPLNPPEILQFTNIWARGQLVTVLLLSPGARASEVEARVPDLLALFDGQYRDYARTRMFVSGHDTLLADTLRAFAGFALDLPRVYRWDFLDSVFIFRNDNPDPAELIREVIVTWRSPIPEALADDDIVEWRLALSREYYTDEQLVEGERAPRASPGRRRIPDPGHLAESPGRVARRWPVLDPHTGMPGPGPAVHDRLVALRPGQGQIRVHAATPEHPRFLRMRGGAAGCEGVDDGWRLVRVA